MAYDKTHYTDNQAPALAAAALNNNEDATEAHDLAIAELQRHIGNTDETLQGVSTIAQAAASSLEAANATAQAANTAAGQAQGNASAALAQAQSANVAASAAEQLAQQAMDAASNGGGSAGSADLGPMWALLPWILNNLSGATSDLVSAGNDGRAAADTTNKFVGWTRSDFYGQQGEDFNAYMGAILYNYDTTPEDLVYSASTTDPDNTGVYQNLPAGLTLDTSSGQISGTPTGHTLAFTNKCSRTWIRVSSASQPELNTSVLLSLYIFPAS